MISPWTIAFRMNSLCSSLQSTGTVRTHLILAENIFPTCSVNLARACALMNLSVCYNTFSSAISRPQIDLALVCMCSRCILYFIDKKTSWKRYAPPPSSMISAYSWMPFTTKLMNSSSSEKRAAVDVFWSQGLKTFILSLPSWSGYLGGMTKLDVAGSTPMRMFRNLWRQRASIRCPPSARPFRFSRIIFRQNAPASQGPHRNILPILQNLYSCTLFRYYFFYFSLIFANYFFNCSSDCECLFLISSKFSKEFQLIDYWLI